MTTDSLSKKVDGLTEYQFVEQLPYSGAKPMFLVDIEDKIILKELINKLMKNL